MNDYEEGPQEPNFGGGIEGPNITEMFAFIAGTKEFRARQAAIQINLDKLSRLSPGSTVRLKTGEEYRIVPYKDVNGDGFEVVGDADVEFGHGGNCPRLESALPLLKACVEAGADVELAHEINPRGLKEALANMPEEGGRR